MLLELLRSNERDKEVAEQEDGCGIGDSGENAHSRSIPELTVRTIAPNTRMSPSATRSAIDVRLLMQVVRVAATQSVAED